jgi:hypothetical protein
MSNKRKTSSRLAREDQGLAAARDHARNPRAMVIFVADADGDTRCCWCDCPGDNPHPEPCAGCSETAVRLIRMLGDGTLPDAGFPVCARHETGFAAMTARTTGITPDVYHY